MKKPTAHQQNLGVHMKIAQHEFSASGDREFIDDMLQWWQERIDDFQLREMGKEHRES